MRKKELRIINFLNLSYEKYMKILDYRNQEFVRAVSNSTEPITTKQHNDYHKLLEKRDIFFAFLITCDDKDYAVINELYNCEGGGVVLHNCMMFICWKLGIKIISYEVRYTNSRGFRVGQGGTLISSRNEENYFYHTSKLYDYDSKILKETKSRKLFDKLYEIKEMQI